MTRPDNYPGAEGFSPIKWKPYLTPVRSLQPHEAKKFLADIQVDKLTLVDVRQPAEYQEGHISGARLIPLPELVERLNEIPKGIPVLVYCSSGPRSRAACQLMAAQDDSFGEIINLIGGFNAWEGEAALGREDQGLTFFTGVESAEEILEIAYGLEYALREFYLSMEKKTNNMEIQELFSKLADIETLHQKKILEEYARITGQGIKEDELKTAALKGPLEGGMTTQEYIDYYMPEWEDPEDIIFLAMAIEGQALDLYLRAAGQTTSTEGQKILTKIAQEEKSHLASLGKLMDHLVSSSTP